MSAASQASERFTFRVEPEKKQLIERAAAVRGLSLTQFAILTLYREAQEVLRTEHVLVLSDEDRDAFLRRWIARRRRRKGRQGRQTI